MTQPVRRLSTTVGLRVDYFSLNKNSAFSPRFSFAYRFSNRTSLNGAAGLFHQNLPLLLLSQNDENRLLKDPSARHYILGITHLLTENTRFSLEIYQKDYKNLPIDPAQPALLLLDELFYRYGFFFNHKSLVGAGEAYSRGVEIMLQKKLAKNFYGLASASYFRTRYKGLDGITRNRVFDNRIIFSLEGGYKPNSKWEFSLRWIFAGGPPYTPFDEEASRVLNRAVLDANNINAARYPDYHSLNVRFDRRFHFSGSNLIFYLSVWNAYNRKNVATYFWNQVENQQGVIRQWGALPIFGLEFEW
jgi:outer membrane receptor protein involved in Fe transport